MPAKDALYFFVFFIDINPNRDATIWLSSGLKYLNIQWNLSLFVVNMFLMKEFCSQICRVDVSSRLCAPYRHRIAKYELQPSVYLR